MPPATFPRCPSACCTMRQEEVGLFCIFAGGAVLSLFRNPSTDSNIQCWGDGSKSGPLAANQCRLKDSPIPATISGLCIVVGSRWLERDITFRVVGSPSEV